MRNRPTRTSFAKDAVANADHLIEYLQRAPLPTAMDETQFSLVAKIRALHAELLSAAAELVASESPPEKLPMASAPRPAKRKFGRSVPTAAALLRSSAPSPQSVAKPRIVEPSTVPVMPTPSVVVLPEKEVANSVVSAAPTEAKPTPDVAADHGTESVPEPIAPVIAKPEPTPPEPVDDAAAVEQPPSRPEPITEPQAMPWRKSKETRREKPEPTEIAERESIHLQANVEKPERFATSSSVEHAVDVAELPTLAETMERTREADRSEVVWSLRWWSVPFVLAASLFCAVAITAVAFDSLRGEWQTSRLAQMVRNPDALPDEIQSVAHGLAPSRTLRFDARREIVLAAAVERIGLGTDADQAKSAGYHLRRAVERAPAVIDYRLDLATVSADLADASPSAEEQWKSIADMPAHETFARIRLAEHSGKIGNLQKSIDELREVLTESPQWTGVVLHRLLDRYVLPKEAIDCVPADPIALAEAVKIAQRRGANSLRGEIELRLTQIVSAAPNAGASVRTADQWLALATVENWLEHWDQAAQFAQNALDLDPARSDGKLAMAQIRYHQNRLEESRRLVEEVLEQRASPAIHEEARLLAEQMNAGPSADPRVGPIRAN